MHRRWHIWSHLSKSCQISIIFWKWYSWYVPLYVNDRISHYLDLFSLALSLFWYQYQHRNMILACKRAIDTVLINYKVGVFMLLFFIFTRSFPQIICHWFSVVLSTVLPCLWQFYNRSIKVISISGILSIPINRL